MRMLLSLFYNSSLDFPRFNIERRIISYRRLFALPDHSRSNAASKQRSFGRSIDKLQ